MRRGGPQHPKVALLAAALGVPRAHAVGLLECLWHWTAAYAPRGDVGRHADAAIATGAGWEGEATTFLETLQRCGLLEADPQYRYVVHNWHRHADQSVQRVLTRRGEWFVTQRKKVRKTPSAQASRRLAAAVAEAEAQAEASSQREEESEKKGDPAMELLEYVNTVGGTHFTPVEANLRFIRARLREVDDWTLAAVIRRQWAAWKDRPDMREYFRPETLFNATKCAQYIGLLTDTDRAWIERQRKAVAS